MHFLHTPSDQLQFVKGTRSLFNFISPKPVKPNIPSIDLLLFEFSVCSLEPITCFNIVYTSTLRYLGALGIFDAWEGHIFSFLFYEG